MLKNKTTPGSHMQVFFVLNIARSYYKYYLPSKAQGHTVISTAIRARQKFDFSTRKGWFFFNSKHFHQENYDVMLILYKSIKVHEKKVLAKTLIRRNTKT